MTDRSQAAGVTAAEYAQEVWEDESPAQGEPFEPVGQSDQQSTAGPKPSNGA
jgi:hypothetical protein